MDHAASSARSSQDLRKTKPDCQGINSVGDDVVASRGLHVKSTESRCDIRGSYYVTDLSDAPILCSDAPSRTRQPSNPREPPCHTVPAGPSSPSVHLHLEQAATTPATPTVAVLEALASGRPATTPNCVDACVGLGCEGRGGIAASEGAPLSCDWEAWLAQGRTTALPAGDPTWTQLLPEGGCWNEGGDEPSGQQAPGNLPSRAAATSQYTSIHHWTSAAPSSGAASAAWTVRGAIHAESYTFRAPATICVPSVSHEANSIVLAPSEPSVLCDGDDTASMSTWLSVSVHESIAGATAPRHGACRTAPLFSPCPAAEHSSVHGAPAWASPRQGAAPAALRQGCGTQRRNDTRHLARLLDRIGGNGGGGADSGACADDATSSASEAPASWMATMLAYASYEDNEDADSIRRALFALLRNAVAAELSVDRPVSTHRIVDTVMNSAALKNVLEGLLQRMVFPTAPREPDMDVDPKAICLGKRLGGGEFGQVHHGFWTARNGMRYEVAVKQLADAHKDDPEVVQAFRDELHLLTKLRHPNIVRCYGGSLAPGAECILLELMAGGSLERYVREERSGSPLKIYEVLHIMCQVARALEALHPTVIHGDIKPGNVLLTEDGVAKVSDFGLAGVKRGRSLLPSTAAMCTYTYAAPEAFKGQPLTEKCDVFALGVLTWEIMTACAPWRQLSLHQVGYAITAGRRPLIPAGCPPGLSSLLQRCWSDNPELRPSAGEVAKQALVLLADLARSDRKTLNSRVAWGIEQPPMHQANAYSCVDTEPDANASGAPETETTRAAGDTPPPGRSGEWDAPPRLPGACPVPCLQLACAANRAPRLLQTLAAAAPRASGKEG